MQLEALQKNGVIRIGLKSSRNILYAYGLPSRPGLICVGHTIATLCEEGVEVAVPEVMEAMTGSEAPRFIMICHHSSAREIAKKIQDALIVDEKLAGVPTGAPEVSHETWFTATLDDVVYAYPPFAKIFLSELPEFSADALEGSGDEVDADATGERSGGAGREGEAMGRRGVALESDIEQEASAWRDLLLLRHEGMRALLSVMLLLAIVAFVAYTALEQIKSSERGNGWLVALEDATGLYLGATRNSESNDDEPEGSLRRAGFVLVDRDFSEWYRPNRGGDTGRTFGLPRQSGTFDVKTWVDGPVGERNLFAAYRHASAEPFVPRDDTEAEASRRLMNSLLDTGGMAEELHAEACATITGAREFVSEPIHAAEILIVYDVQILRHFAADTESCLGGTPRFVEPE